MIHLLLAMSLAVVTPTPAAQDENLAYWTRTVAQHAHELVRKNAARTLGTLGNVEAVPALVQALKDTNHEVRLEAARALGKLGDERAFGPLHETAQRDSDRGVRRAAQESIDVLNQYVEYQKKKKEELEKKQKPAD